jgi:hypothetical protein
MQPTDTTIEVLKGIRDEVRGLRGDVAHTNARLEALRQDTNANIEALRIDTNARLESLGHRQMDTEIRLSAELGLVAGAVREVRDALDNRELRQRVDDHERRLVALESRGG